MSEQEQIKQQFSLLLTDLTKSGTAALEQEGDATVNFKEWGVSAIAKIAHQLTQLDEDSDLIEKVAKVVELKDIYQLLDSTKYADFKEDADFVPQPHFPVVEM